MKILPLKVRIKLTEIGVKNKTNLRVKIAKILKRSKIIGSRRINVQSQKFKFENNCNLQS